MDDGSPVANRRLAVGQRKFRLPRLASELVQRLVAAGHVSVVFSVVWRLVTRRCGPSDAAWPRVAFAPPCPLCDARRRASGGR